MTKDKLNDERTVVALIFIHLLELFQIAKTQAINACFFTLTLVAIGVMIVGSKTALIAGSFIAIINIGATYMDIIKYNSHIAACHGRIDQFTAHITDTDLK